MFHFALPQYYIKPQVFLVYDDGKKRLIDGYCNLAVENIELEPTLENAKAFLAKHVPEEFHSTVRYVSFRAEQPLKKIRYGQGELADDGRVYVSSAEFSVDVVEWELDRLGYKKNKKTGEWENDQLIKASKKVCSRRLNHYDKDVDGAELPIYIKSDT
jgi:hypothetical protein